jgi:uridine monophosphate synthetase
MSSRSQQPRHRTWSLSFKERAQLPGTPALAAYLLHLIAIKKSNLCLSADVSTTAELLKLAEETGDSICLLKTHADIVNDWSDRTVRKLREIAKKKRFLVFEDRKFGDIGSTLPRDLGGRFTS